MSEVFFLSNRLYSLFLKGSKPPRFSDYVWRDFGKAFKLQRQCGNCSRYWYDISWARMLPWAQMNAFEDGRQCLVVEYSKEFM